MITEQPVHLLQGFELVSINLHSCGDRSALIAVFCRRTQKGECEQSHEPFEHPPRIMTSGEGEGNALNCVSVAVDSTSKRRQRNVVRVRSYSSTIHCVHPLDAIINSVCFVLTYKRHNMIINEPRLGVRLRLFALCFTYVFVSVLSCSFDSVRKVWTHPKERPGLLHDLIWTRWQEHRCVCPKAVVDRSLLAVLLV